ncbi:MAG: sigma-54-dependent Fis family transcriptional regulator [Deltaproteobacteria bacterium]|nr:sigma-54-dependent Fis family transcriptional regulator [Deltaproteobacteria bacterium]MBN2674646.1 sigma-54-dependent Fis family transcriptional regulator [Deltaproteobacteria bacterium]
MNSFESSKSVLIIGTQTPHYRTFYESSAQLQFNVQHVFTMEEARQKIETTRFDAIVLDAELAHDAASEYITAFHSSRYLPEILVIQDSPKAEEASTCVQAGAWGVVRYSSSAKKIQRILRQIFQYQTERQRRFPRQELNHPNIIGSSPALKRCFHKMAVAAQGDLNVLITGETGTGKELIASTIHDNSPRRHKPFVVVDCTALPENLVENMLFGHEKGAYTGADDNREGLLREVHGGTLFLDEIGELPLEIQTKFLRILQQKTFRPIGSKTERQSDFRLVAATNQNLEHLVQKKQFREDLLFRLKSMTIVAPPLRDRVDDIEPLTVFHVQKLCAHYNLPSKHFSSDFFDFLSTYDWPGNVRELNQAMERAVLNSNHNPMIYPRDLPDDIRAKIIHASTGTSDSIFPPRYNTESVFGFLSAESLPPLCDVRTEGVRQIECSYFRELLRRHHTDIQKAIQTSGLSRSRFYTLLKKHRLSTSNEANFR